MDEALAGRETHQRNCAVTTSCTTQTNTEHSSSSTAACFFYEVVAPRQLQRQWRIEFAISAAQRRAMRPRSRTARTGHKGEDEEGDGEHRTTLGRRVKPLRDHRHRLVHQPQRSGDATEHGMRDGYRCHEQEQERSSHNCRHDTVRFSSGLRGYGRGRRDRRQKPGAGFQ